LRVRFEKEPEAGREVLLVADLSREATQRAVLDATVAVTLSGDGETQRTVAGQPAKVAGRYGFVLRFDRPGTRRLDLAITFGDGQQLGAAFQVAVAPRSVEPKEGMTTSSGMRPGMRSGMQGNGGLPRNPPDPGMRPAPGDLPRPPVDPPAPPVDPDPDPS
jgi:hypothetical protein